MNVKSVILIGAALLFAGGTAFVASRLMSHKPAQQAQVKEDAAKKVLVAKGNLPAGTFIKEEDVSWQKWPSDGINDNYLLEGQSDINNIVGAVVRKGIVAGEPITESKVARPGDRGFLAAVLTPGMRAISIDVDEPSSVAGLVFPGDRVDVLLNMKFKIEQIDQQNNPISKYNPHTSETVLENVRLLATDRTVNDIEGEPKKLNTVTIEVTPKQAEMIKVAASMGKLQLSLRGLGTPEGQTPGPTVASAQAAATNAQTAATNAQTAATSAQTAATSFFAQRAADKEDGPEMKQPPKDKPNANGVDDDPVPERGQTYTFDLEVSRPMQELMKPSDVQVVQVVRGSSTGDPRVQNVVPWQNDQSQYQSENNN